MIEMQGAAASTSHLVDFVAEGDQAEEIAKKAGDSFVTAEMLLLALTMAQGTDAARILKSAGVNPQNLNNAIKELRQLTITALNDSEFVFVDAPPRCSAFHPEVD